MAETFITTINQILIIFSFILIGYFVRKKHIGGDNVSTVLSALLVNIFLPAMCIKTFSENFTLSDIAQSSAYLLAGTVTLAGAFVVAKLFTAVFAENKLQKDVYMYSFLIPNLGYMGYPLIEGIFGPEMLCKMMIFVLPFNIAIYTYGIYILNPKHEMSFKGLLNPNIVSMFIGMLIGITGIKLPSFAVSVINSAKACMSPSAMILTGVVLAGIPLKPVLLSLKSYFAALVRGIVIPGIAFLIMYLLKVPNDILIIAVGTLAMPMGLNSIVFPEAYGGDSATGAKTCTVSNIVSIITIPLVFAILGSFL